MIAYFANYLAILAAIYFSMCLDKVLTTRIWSNDYFVNFSNAIEQSSTIARSVASNIIENSRKDTENIQEMLIKKSVYMLTLVSFVLIYCGFEQNLSTEQTVLESMQATISATAFVSFVLFNILFSSYVYTRWWFMIVAVCANLILYYKIGEYIVNNESILCIFETYSKEIIVAFFTLPIIWQIWVCFVYKKIYPIYITEVIKRIGVKYQLVLEGISSGKLEKIPEEYRMVIDKHTIQNQTKTVQEVIDSSMDEYVDVLQKRIKDVGIKVNVHKILFMTIWFYIEGIYNNIKTIIKKTSITGVSLVPTMGGLSMNVNIVSESDTISRYGYEALKAEYLKCGKSVEEFCTEKEINIEDFKHYIKKNDNN